MSIVRDPTVDDARKVTHTWYEQNSPQHRPSLAAEEQHSSHAALGCVHRSIDVDELHGFLAVVSCHSVPGETEVEIEPLPRLAPRMTANALLDESDARRAKGAISVVDENRHSFFAGHHGPLSNDRPMLQLHTAS